MQRILLLTTFAALCTAAPAANIALTDPSLELGFSGTNGIPVSGWFTFGSAQGAQQINGGFWSDWTNEDGVNGAYATSISETDGGSIYQTIELDAGVTYTLTVGVGMSTTSSGTKDAGKWAVVFFNQSFSTLLAETTGTVTSFDSTFTDATVQFTPATSGIYQIGFRNRGYEDGLGSENGSTLFFDNARLTAVPEPSVALLGGLGLVALLRRRRD